MDRWDMILGPADQDPEGEAPAGFYHAWYASSAHAFPFCSMPAYYDSSGKLVAVSEVSRLPKPVSAWKDLQYIGIVSDKCVITGQSLDDDLPSDIVEECDHCFGSGQKSDDSYSRFECPWCDGTGIKRN